MRASELTEQRVNLAYEGPTLRTMLWLLITFVVSIFIVFGRLGDSVPLSPDTSANLV